MSPKLGPWGGVAFKKWKLEEKIHPIICENLRRSIKFNGIMWKRLHFGVCAYCMSFCVKDQLWQVKGLVWNKKCFKLVGNLELSNLDLV